MTNKKFLMDNIYSVILNRGIHLLILILFILLIPGAIVADGGMMVWPPQIQLMESAQNAIVAWNGEEEILIISNDIKGSNSATVLRMIPLPFNPTNIEEGDFNSFSKITEIINKKGKVLGRYRGLGGVMIANSLGSEGTPPGVEITFHKNIGAHDVTVARVNDLDYFLNWIKDFATGKNLETKEISPKFKDGISNYLDRNINYFVFDVIEKTEQQQSINPLIYKFKSNYLFYPLEITAISEIGQTQYAEVNVFLIFKGMINEDIVKKVNLYPSVDFDYYIELNKKDLRRVSPQLESLFQSDPFMVLIYHWGNLSELDKDLVIYSQDIHIPTASDRINHFFQFITLKFLNPLFRAILNFIFLLIIWPVSFIYLFFYLAKLIKKQVKQKVLKPIIVNSATYIGALVISLGVFFVFYFLLSIIDKIDYGFLLISLIEIIICVVILFLIIKSIVKLFKKYIFKKSKY